MDTERAIAIQGELISRVRDLYSQARMFKLESKQIDERYNKLFERYPKLPRYVENYVRGYRDCLANALYHSDLFHAYEWKGQLYSNWDSYPDELKDHIRSTQTDDLIHGHYWVGTNKPFYLGSK